MLFRTAKISQISEFDETIDVRTPSEFNEDHIPGAINCPVLSNEERIIVGTLYKQVSPFEARVVGGAMVAKNIAHHLEELFSKKPKTWRPLIYCWRGGQRSGAMSIILSQIGWAAHKLEGGYKSYRRSVLEQMELLPSQLTWRVICGPTGSGKSRLLSVLQEHNCQVLDLEGLALHRGSVLGGLPDTQQPSQKSFDSILLFSLQKMDPKKPVYIEAESHKIGQIRIPPALTTAMHASNCIFLETPLSTRIDWLIQDYPHYLENPEQLINHLQALLRFHGHKQLARWTALIHLGDFETLLSELLTLHYDPIYQQTASRNYQKITTAQHMQINDLSDLQSITEHIDHSVTAG